MSEGDYREHSRYEFDSDVGDPEAQTEEPEVVDLSREALLKEMARFDNFDVNSDFTEEEWNSFSPTLKGYVQAKRFLIKRPDLVALEVRNPNLTKEATINPDDHVTVRTKSRTSGRSEQSEENNRDEDTKDSRDAEFSESLRRTATSLMKSGETEEVKSEAVEGDIEDLLQMVVMRDDFTASMDNITKRLEQIPQDLDAHEVVLKNELSAMSESLKKEIITEVGIAMRAAIYGPAAFPSMDNSVENRIPFIPDTPLELAERPKLPAGLNTPMPSRYSMQAPMGTVMSQKAMSMLPSPVRPMTSGAVNRQLMYSGGIPSAASVAPASPAAATSKTPVMRVIAQRDPATMGLKLRGMEIGAVIEFLHEYNTKKLIEEEQTFKITKFLTTSQLTQLYQYAKQETLFLGEFHDFLKLDEACHVSVLHHMVRAKNVEDYRTSLKYVKFAWIEGTDIDHTVIADFLLRAQEYTSKFQQVCKILNVHTEPKFIPPMHAPNRSVKVTLLGCYLDGFPNHEGEGKCNTVGWRVYDAANQALGKKPQHVWTSIEQLSDCLLLEFHEFWKASQSQIEHMRVLNTRKVLERKLPVSSGYSKSTSGYERKSLADSDASKPVYKTNQRRFMGRSGKVYVLGSTTPLVKPDEDSLDNPAVEELEEEASSVHDEEVPVDSDNQLEPDDSDIGESDLAYLDYLGQLDSKPKSDAYGGCYTQFYSRDGKCNKGKECKWDHTERGMKHCLKQTLARCRTSKFFPQMDEYIKMCREPMATLDNKPGAITSKRS
jgi:hypothetical protein